MSDIRIQNTGARVAGVRNMLLFEKTPMFDISFDLIRERKCCICKSNVSPVPRFSYLARFRSCSQCCECHGPMTR